MRSISSARGLPGLLMMALLLVACWPQAQDDQGEPNGAGDDNGVEETGYLAASNTGACGEILEIGEQSSRQDGREEWCGAERLQWSYEAESETLDLLHSRVALNCCAEHSVSYEQVGDIHVVTEIDVPPRDGRCRCTCLFDFHSSLAGIASGMASVLVLLDIEEEEGSSVVWEGDLDLTEGSGEIVLDDTESSLCEVYGP
ncbi:MAG: hypothetical protein ACOC0J_01250 [Myxococcota bacterium]